MFARPLFREPNKTAKLKCANINCRPKMGRISNYMVLTRQNEGAKIILHAKSPTFREAKLKGFYSISDIRLFLKSVTKITYFWRRTLPAHWDSRAQHRPAVCPVLRHDAMPWKDDSLGLPPDYPRHLHITHTHSKLKVVPYLFNPFSATYSKPLLFKVFSACLLYTSPSPRD